MKPVGSKLAAQYIGATPDKLWIQVHINYAELRAVNIEQAVYLGDIVCASSQTLPPPRALVYRQDALHIQLGIGSVAAYTVYQPADERRCLSGSDTVTEIIDTHHEEYAARFPRQDLAQAMGNAHGIVAGNAAVYNIIGTQHPAPIAAILGKTVAQHHRGGGVNRRQRRKHVHPLAIVAGRTVSHLLSENMRSHEACAC